MAGLSVAFGAVREYARPVAAAGFERGATPGPGGPAAGQGALWQRAGIDVTAERPWACVADVPARHAARPGEATRSARASEHEPCESSTAADCEKAALPSAEERRLP